MHKLGRQLRDIVKAKFHQSSRSKTWSQTCVTCTSGSQTSRKHVANPFEDCTLLTSQVTRSWVEIESVLDLSRHVEIDLARFRAGFRYKKF